MTTEEIQKLTGALTDKALADTIDHLGEEQIKYLSGSARGDITISEKDRQEIFAVAIPFHLEAARRLRILAS